MTRSGGPTYKYNSKKIGEAEDSRDHTRKSPRAEGFKFLRLKE